MNAKGETVYPGQPESDYRHIDPSDLLEAVGGDVHTVAALARTFVESAPAIFARLEQATLAGNADACRHESHTLKGMCALFNARVLSALLLQAEQDGRQGRVPRPEELAQLQAGFAQVLDEIRHCARPAQTA
ncbi:MAG TPA: Hpt domain-containing protein [Herbaspirillum sp.]|uniref:Hpt domain-containing protein n=1 Tax=Herbaspirillum sp. TaxID=1890675 RepID=UPI002D3D7816|nr:Hpt domain-containing protein [Herbaspirillum sp.]HZG20574.1 Hpt domain-containing protein [Herbaspirillum sp.]